MIFFLITFLFKFVKNIMINDLCSSSQNIFILFHMNNPRIAAASAIISTYRFKFGMHKLF